MLKNLVPYSEVFSVFINLNYGTALSSLACGWEGIGVPGNLL
jgi:hypothetical protein